MKAKAYVLVKTAIHKSRSVYEKLGLLPGVLNVEAVTGPFDIIMLIESTDFNKLANLVLSRIQAIDGVTDTITCNCIFFEN